MKKLVLTIAALLVAVGAYAQGTVSFANNASSLVLNALNGNAPVANSEGVVVGLYWAPLGSTTFTLLTPTAALGIPAAGRYNGGTRTTGPETPPGGMAQFQVRAWELVYGSTYEAAIAAAPMGGRASLRGTSNVLTMPTGAPPTVTPQSLTSFGLNSFVVDVPEPSVVALGLIGAGALLLLRRRK